ncbi:acyl-CoA-binding domain-containing protein 4 isoform X1 [Lepisosteus oculatus]|uniref:acyl-CoA-binding domain-containing protein 4 isoform X1 n=2 Tax=Lepisosteus oculatus TaxID=7918 RepID=UPI00371DA058
MPLEGRGEAVPAGGMALADQDCHRRFQTAVCVIQNLPKTGCYKPSYDVMLRLYGLYKQATCGPCRLPRPGFWDPVGRYKWDSWKRLGNMSHSAAMTAYVDEIKRVAQEVIDTMPVTEKTAALFHYFKPLYHVIHDMPQLPEALQSLRAGLERTDTDSGASLELSQELQSLGNGELRPAWDTVRTSGCQGEVSGKRITAGVVLEGPRVSSDSEGEVFCDSLERLDHDKCDQWLNGLGSDHTPVAEATQMGLGQGGERGQRMRRRGSPRAVREGRREETRSRDRGDVPRAGRALAGGAGAGGRGGEEGGPGVGQGAAVQEQVALALRRLQEDMRHLLERLETLERLTPAQEREPGWRPAARDVTPAEKGPWYGAFGVSGRTLLFLLLWPFLAQGLASLLWHRHRKVRKAA